jgi:dTDP-4-amino-4,6-dideoxygalactose transaminase
VKKLNNKKILVTSPLLPNLDDFYGYLKEIWDRKWITNNGIYHKELESALSEYLGIPYISLFTNGTLPLITALQALEIKGEVITTPYSFVATSHSLWWNKVRPVFVDIEEDSFNINPDRIEEAITDKTTAIMPVHVYGNPCDTDKIQEIADRYGLKIIYDAAHAFGVTINGKSILEYGDMSTLSFHATKVFNTVEGGALIVKDEQTKKTIDYLKNFGFAGETEVVAPGINSKMDEIRAAFGLLNLMQIDSAISERKRVASSYLKGLKDINGISLPRFERQDVKYNYSYFPILIDTERYGMERDDLYIKMKENNIYGRRYFYPIISDFSMYSSLESARPENLPVAKQVASRVICLPIYPELTQEEIEYIIFVIKHRGCIK